MDWYYVENGQRSGPVQAEQFTELARSGRITPETLVWQEGMVDWQPYRTVAPQTQAPPLIPGTAAALVPGTAVCAECGRHFSKDDLVSFQDAWVCGSCKPLFVQRLREGAPPALADRIWRSGKTLVMAPGTPLPDRCVKCNAPVSRPPIKRTLYWHQPWVYLLVLISILIYAIVAIIIRKKAPIAVPVCDEHRAKRRMFIAVGWLLALLGLGLLFVMGTSGSGIWIFGGIAIFLTGVVLGVWKGTLVSAKKIDDRFVWVKGVCPEFLESLPEWRDGW